MVDVYEEVLHTSPLPVQTYEVELLVAVDGVVVQHGSPGLAPHRAHVPPEHFVLGAVQAVPVETLVLVLVLQQGLPGPPQLPVVPQLPLLQVPGSGVQAAPLVTQTFRAQQPLLAQVFPEQQSCPGPPHAAAWVLPPEPPLAPPAPTTTVPPVPGFPPVPTTTVPPVPGLPPVPGGTVEVLVLVPPPPPLPPSPSIAPPAPPSPAVVPPAAPSPPLLESLQPLNAKAQVTRPATMMNGEITHVPILGARMGKLLTMLEGRSHHKLDPGKDTEEGLEFWMCSHVGRRRPPRSLLCADCALLLVSTVTTVLGDPQGHSGQT